MPIKFKKQAKTSKRIGLSGKGGCGKSYAITNLYKKPIVLDLERKWPDKPPFNKIPTVDLNDQYTYESVILALTDILNQDVEEMKKGKYEALVIDTISEMEQYCISHAIQRDYKGEKEKYSSYMRGDNQELPIYFGEFLRLLRDIEVKFGWDILIICHSDLGTEKNPMGEDYGKNVLDLKKRTRAQLLKWLDFLGSVYEDNKIKKEGITAKIESSTRMVSFDNSIPFFDAKCLADDAEKTVPFDIEGTWVGKVFNKGGNQ